MKAKSIASSFFMHFILSIGALLSLFPFYWLVITSTVTSSDVMRFPPVFIPGDQFFINVRNLLTAVNFGSSLLNSLFVSGTITLSVVLLASLAGFLFAKFSFPFKKTLFAVVLLTMMLPSQMNLVPLFMIMNRLGWASTFKALILPNLVTAFGIFWIRQFAQGAIHDDLLNAGRIDGCGTLRLFTRIGFPVLMPGLSFLAVYTFMNTWNDYLWPLVILNQQSKHTVQVALAQLNSVYYASDYGMVMAGTLLATLPLLLVFLAVGGQLMNNITAGAIKG